MDELQPHITRAVDYLKSGHVRNSTAILETLTPQIAEWAAENGSLEEMEMEDKTSMEELFANMVSSRSIHTILDQITSKLSIGSHLLHLFLLFFPFRFSTLSPLFRKRLGNK